MSKTVIIIAGLLFLLQAGFSQTPTGKEIDSMVKQSAHGKMKTIKKNRHGIPYQVFWYSKETKNLVVLDLLYSGEKAIKFIFLNNELTKLVIFLTPLKWKSKGNVYYFWNGQLIEKDEIKPTTEDIASFPAQAREWIKTFATLKQ